MEGLSQMETEIAKRRTDVDTKVREMLKFITEKGHELTADDKKFLKARFSYLSRAQKEEYGYILNEDLSSDTNTQSADSSTLDEEMRVDLEKRARAAGVKNPERFKSKQAILDAITSAQLVENK